MPKTDPMTLDIMNIDKFTQYNAMAPTNSALFFTKEGNPDEQGLFSYDIYGLPGSRDRKNVYSYIDLGSKFIHPHVYKLIVYVNRKYGELLNGNKSFLFDEKTGDFKPLERDAVDVPGSGTGIDFFYKYYDKVKFRASDSKKRSVRLDLLTSLKKEEVFINKWPVIPAFYRDITYETASSSQSTNVVNGKYKQLIIKCNALKSMQAGLDYGYEYSKSVVQSYLNDTYDHFVGLLKLKHGFIHQGVMRKNVDHGVRTIITAPTFDAERWDNMPADYNHIALPLTQAMTLFIPFIHKAINDFVQLITGDMIYSITTKQRVTLAKDWTLDWTYEEIVKKVELFESTPEIRFNTLKFRTKDSGTVDMVYMDLDNQKVFTISNFEELNSLSGRNLRHMTWTDLLYYASVIASNDRHVLVTRYPVNNLHSEYFAGVKVRSTFKTLKNPMNIYGVEVEDWPDITRDLKIAPEKIISLFIDTLEIFSPYIKGLGADHDGDAVILRGLWDNESNAEAKTHINSIKNSVGINGKSIRDAGDVGLHTLYNLTRWEE